MNKPETIKIKTPFVVGFAATIIIIAGAMYAESFVTSILLALFISIIFAQPIAWLQKKKVPQTLAVAIVFIVTIIVFMGLGELIGSSFSSFSEDAPKYQENLNEMGASFKETLKNKGINLPTETNSKLFNPSKIMGITTSFLGELGSLMSNTFTILFLVLFLLIELDSFKLKEKAITAGSNISLSYFNKIGQSIRHYLSIKTVTSLITGGLIWIGLAIIGVDYAILWALIAFLLNFIPNIGSIIAAIPAVLFALIQLGFGGAIWTIIIFLAVNMLVGNMLEPKMMGKGLGLSTFVIFVSLLFWGFVLGSIGMFLSIPLTMAIKIILEQNDKTRWIAVLLGTDDDALALIDDNKQKNNKT